MKKLLIAVTFLALVAAGSGFALYESGAAQHRNPAPSARPAQPQQAQQPRQSQPAPPPAQPREGHTAPPATPKSGQAVPRGSEAHNQSPGHPGHGPEHVVVPYYPGWAWWGYPYYPYPYDYPPYEGRLYAEWETAKIRLDVSPKDAQVYVDSFYAGVIDDFDGIFQHLTLRAGPHLVEIVKPGFATLVAEFNLSPGQSVTYRRTMQPSGDVAGTPAPVPFAPGFEEGASLPSPRDVAGPPGEVRFDVTPKNAEIYADGFYAGLVDDFNGSQRLQLAPGRHHVVVRLEGYETIEVDMSIDSGRSITYRATLTRSAQR
jgi:hypothetical protein